MRLSIVFPMAALAFVAVASIDASGKARSEAANIPDAEAVIAECWQLSNDVRSSENTDAQRAGHLRTALCLENSIAENAEKLIPAESLSRDSIDDKLKQIRFAFGGIYWAIYNDHNGCNISCGTIYQSFHNSALARLYERILRDVIAQRKKYGV